MTRAAINLERAARLGAAVVFRSNAPGADGHHQRRRTRWIVDEAWRAEQLALIDWRPVPVEPAALGDLARSTAPRIEQAIVTVGASVSSSDAEARCYRARKRVERAVRAAGLGAYVASMSFRTLTYKAMCAADQLAAFYPDLRDRRFTAPFAIFHQRYSTNTAPSWERAQPFRMLCHNGEINTIQGNVNRMRTREGRLGAVKPAAEALLVPVIDERGSDSAMLDNALELLVRGGRDIREGLAMLVPEAWEGFDVDPTVRDFYRYHACLMEPWDGPAGLVFTDGTRVGAVLDRNGLRPLRYAVCEDGLIACASEAGAVDVSGHGRVRRGKLGPGEMLCVDPEHGGLEENDAIKTRLAAREPYGRWLEDNLQSLDAGEPDETVMPGPDAARLVQLDSFLLYPSGLEAVRALGTPLASSDLDATYAVADGASGLRAACERLAEDAERAARSGASILIVTDRDAGPERAPIPALLAVGSVHHHLMRHGLRGQTSLVVETDEAREVHHVVCLLGYGAQAICPRLGLAAIRALASVGHLKGEAADGRGAQEHYVKALEDGTLKGLAKMGISTLGGYPGAQIFEIIGLDADVVDLGFVGTPSPIGGATFTDLGEQVLEHHAAGFATASPSLVSPGFFKHHKQGTEYHATNPDVVDALHDAVPAEMALMAPTLSTPASWGGEVAPREMAAAHALQRAVATGPDGNGYASYERFARLVNDRPPTYPRDLLTIRPVGAPVPLSDVEPATAILRRFSNARTPHRPA